MKLVVYLLVILLIQGCSMAKDTSSYNNRVYDFLNKLDSIQTTVKQQDVIEKFNLVFSDFKQGATEENIRQLYADKFYFNDTFTTISDIDTLVSYMQETAKKVEITTVDILDLAASDNDYYIRWIMHMRFEARGRVINSKSIGMTQLRFNTNGKVILHQDYWDGAEGFYQHLPYIGYIVRKIRDSL